MRVMHRVSQVAGTNCRTNTGVPRPRPQAHGAIHCQSHVSSLLSRRQTLSYHRTLLTVFLKSAEVKCTRQASRQPDEGVAAEGSGPLKCEAKMSSR